MSHVKSTHDPRFGSYMIHVGGFGGEDGVEDYDVFVYDVEKDERGADVIVNFGSLQDKKARLAAQVKS